jgi:hypothetical protein
MSMEQMARFQPVDDTEVSFNDDEFQAGFDARMRGEELYFTATRSWRAGWADADQSEAVVHHVA